MINNLDNKILSSIKTIIELNNLNSAISNKREYIISDITDMIDIYKNKAKKHIYYLKCIMFILMCFLWEFNILKNESFYITCFLILFNIAFIENMLSNLLLKNYTKESKFILEAQKTINTINLNEDDIDNLFKL
jgi:hypothetical protein